ncbi:MAG TPA: FKBP-type peptidyl-prolyl cis-trans isomerase [Flavobacterium sp.]|nr:FKBP-type peptidyl-prolyl cis-trans isomerase [Flavobacterium sp.]
MNRFKYYFVLLLAGLAIVSCNKKDDDEIEVTPIRDYKVQYEADKDSIEKFLKTNYIENVTADFEAKISKIPAGGTQTSIWDQQTYKLQSREVYSNDVKYKVYYLVLREGTGESPTNTDRVSVAYSCYLMNNTLADSSYGNPFTANLFPFASGNTVIQGWSEIMPKFRTGDNPTTSNDGVITYDNYGAGVMFLPSGLAYYASPSGVIPAYSCIYFNIKLFALQRMDNEYNVTSTGITIVGDGVPDYLEDINGDGYLYDLRNTTRYPNPPDYMLGDDSDKDGIPDYLDFDDDGDGYTTRLEVTKPTDQIGWGKLNGENFYYGISKYYPYNAPVPDNPATPNVDESEPWGIPRRPTGVLKDPSKPESKTNPRAFVPEDYTTPDRLRIHLDKTYPYPF